MSQVFAKYYDRAMKPLEEKYLTAWRRELLKHATGKVLEVGSGTGVNFPLYQRCDEVTAIEPNVHMTEKATDRKAQAQVPIQLITGKSEKLPFQDESFDTVVITLVLCSVQDMRRTIKECRRVLKPYGKLLVLEHVKMEQPILASLQNVLTPAWRKLADGCHLNRDPEELISENGFEVTARKRYLSSLVLSLVARKI